MGAGPDSAMTEFQLPETRYAQSDNVSIAYQVMGDGPIDMILVSGFISHIEFQHCWPVTPIFCGALQALRAW